MPDHLAACLTISKLTVTKGQENERLRKIAALEARNFDLRNQITRLQLHNATLRRMLKLKGNSSLAALEGLRH
jgi:uncharacterized protein YicC (UPF0701 family)